MFSLELKDVHLLSAGRDLTVYLMSSQSVDTPPLIAERSIICDTEDAPSASSRKCRTQLREVLRQTSHRYWKREIPMSATALPSRLRRHAVCWNPQDHLKLFIIKRDVAIRKYFRANTCPAVGPCSPVPPIVRRRKYSQNRS